MIEADLLGGEVASVPVSWGGHEFTMIGTSVSDHIFTGLAKSGKFYEPELLRGTQDLLEPGDFVVDAGANIGNHSIFWGGVCGARVLAVEPSRTINEVLRANVQANDLEASVFPRTYALGHSLGKAFIVPGSKSNSGQTRIESSDDGDVVIRPLDEVPEVNENKVRLLKVDVEGMELDVLQGARSLLERHKPVVVSECLDDEQYERVSSFLRIRGYAMMECFNYSPTYLFVHNSWDYPARFTRIDHLSAIAGRNSRAVNTMARRLTNLHRDVAGGS